MASIHEAASATSGVPHGSSNSGVERRIAEGSASDRVVFAGRIPHGEVPAYLDSCDIRPRRGPREVHLASECPKGHRFHRLKQINTDQICVIRGPFPFTRSPREQNRCLAAVEVHESDRDWHSLRESPLELFSISAAF